MTLRTSERRRTPGLRHPRFSLPAALAVAALLLTLLAGASGAGISAYQGTLYLDGPASSISGNYQLLTAAPAAQGVAPVAAQGVVGSGGLVAGAYRWVYVTTSGGALTASVASNQPNISANTPALVSNVPVGADVYRARIVSGNTGRYTFVGTNAGPTTTYTDTNTSTLGAILPQADTRVPINTTGYIAFVPGTALGGLDSTMTSSNPPTIPSTCSGGWTVDSSAGFTFPAGMWTINAQVRPDNPGLSGGAAALSTAVWKVDASGNTIAGGTIVPLTDSGALALNNTSQTATISYTTASATTLDAGERLCVQFWRHQTTATTGGGPTNRTMWLLAYDPNNRISVHPAPNAFATAALSSPADGLHTQTIPTLSATYSDNEGDAGNITLRVCPDAGCSSSQTSGAIAANNGDTKSWTPTGLGDGTYYWSAQAQDSGGLPSAWTSARTFVIDTVAPTTSIDSKPNANSNAASGSFGFSGSEAVTGFQCHIDGAAWSGCTSPLAYGPLADGAHTFYVRATADLAGNAGTTSSYGWTVDTAAPDTSILSKPSSLSNSASPSFTFSATEPGSTFECKLDGGAFAICSSPKSYSGVADGAHTFQVRATDLAGNVDATPDSYAWTIDATPPNTSIGPSQPALLTIATGATFDFSSNEAGSTFACSLDGAAFTACSTPKSYAALADGSHTFQVRATDTAANVDPSPASYTWTVDTTPPVSSIGPTTPPAHTSSTSATFDLGSNEAGSTFECSLDGGAFASCATPKTYSALADGAHTFAVRAIDQAGNVDTSPATDSWSVDNVAPTAPTLVSPADATLTNAIPQLDASFDDATAGGDTGSIDFQLCTSAATAGTSCAPLAQSGSAGSLSSGGTGSWTPGALADGTYYWQGRATDAAGNQSGWSATHSFQLDTSVPTVPATDSPDGAWMSRIQLKATFSKPSFAGTGELEFRVCSDGLCLGVVRSGFSGTMVNGSETTWSPSTQPGDGLWYWQVRSHDSAGNVSAWSATRVLHLDSVAPGKPVHFNGVVAGDGLTLRWEAPNDTIANYVVFVNGAPWKNFGSTEFEVKMGSFDATDTRTFSVVAVDLAGNVGAMSATLVGVPNLVGMSWAQAQSAASTRGLVASPNIAAFSSVPMFVDTQDPAAPALLEKGGALHVTLAAAKGAPLAVRVRPGKVNCKRGCTLRLRVELSSTAFVKSRLLGSKGRLLKRASLGSLHAGANTVRVQIPRALRKGSYRLVLDASGESGSAHAQVRVFLF